MAYTPNPTWKPGVAGGTIISAVALNRIETGLVAVAAGVDTANLRVNTAINDISNLSAQLSQLTTRIDNLPTGSGGSSGTGVAIVG